MCIRPVMIMELVGDCIVLEQLVCLRLRLRLKLRLTERVRVWEV